MERWRRIVHEAAQQSRRSDVPLIHEPGRWLRGCAPRQRPRASCSPSRSGPRRCAMPLKKQSRRPEKKCLRWRLPLDRKADGRRRKKRCSTPTVGALCRWGRAILRAETAAIAALAVVARTWSECSTRQADLSLMLTRSQRGPRLKPANASAVSPVIKARTSNALPIRTQGER